jgi:hypothetical protein
LQQAVLAHGRSYVQVEALKGVEGLVTKNLFLRVRLAAARDAAAVDVTACMLQQSPYGPA